jgi:NAD(P)-dependent dehydrogenase (short-subunit alcohol dehydrogenase family)
MTFKYPVTNKVIAITGAASGIGLTTAKMLANRGALLSLADLNAASLDAVKADLKAENPSLDVITTALDVRNVSEVDAWITNTVQHFGRLDGALNLAGVIGKSLGNPVTGGVKDLTDDEWEFVVGINLTGVFNCMRAQLRVMADGGSVVSASSIAGITGRGFNSTYSAAKHGVVGLTRSAAKEVGVRGIRVNCICP